MVLRFDVDFGVNPIQLLIQIVYFSRAPRT